MIRFKPITDSTFLRSLYAGTFGVVLLLSAAAASGQDPHVVCTGLRDSLGFPVHRMITYPGLEICTQDGIYTCTYRGWEHTSTSCSSGPSRTWYVDDLPGGPGNGSSADPFRRVQDALDAARDGDRVYIRDGEYEAQPRSYVDPTCGNCNQGSYRPQIVSVGFYAVGKSLIVDGESRDGVVLVTGAQYGFMFEHAGTSIVRHLTVTGGVRGENADTTDAALLARYSLLLARDLRIEYNLDVIGGGSDVRDVGIVGIAGREGAALTVENCLIRKNSWDGIALYRGDRFGNRATAAIYDNVITEGPPPPGRGAGIGLTWDSAAIARRNEISSYVKGVIAVGNSVSELTNNVIRDGAAWGIGASNDATVYATNNVIARMDFGTYVFDDRQGGVPYLVLRNNIFYGNREVGIAWQHPRLRPSLFYNDVFNEVYDLAECRGTTAETCEPRTFGAGDIGNLDGNPEFVEPEANDFTLACTSPARDAGDPEPIYNDPDGSRNDMGIYGGPYAAVGNNACADGPDLTPTAIVYDPAQLIPGNVVLFDSGVANLGDVDSEVFNVRWLVDGQDVGAYGSHLGVPAATTVLDGNSAYLWTVTPGVHTITFLVDVDDHVTESDESNNTTSVTVGFGGTACVTGTLIYNDIQNCLTGPVDHPVDLVIWDGTDWQFVQTVFPDANGNFCANLDWGQQYQVESFDTQCFGYMRRCWANLERSDPSATDTCGGDDSGCEDLDEVDFYCES